MEVEGAEPASGMQPQIEALEPERGFIERLKAKPDEIKQWWADLTAVFDKSFLAMIHVCFSPCGNTNLVTTTCGTVRWRVRCQRPGDM